MLKTTLLYWLLVSAVKVAYLIVGIKRKRKTCLVIEAGEIGWSHIDYQEQLQSAREYLGHDNVVKSIIDKSADYVTQVKNSFEKYNPSHYFYDCRSGSDDPVKGLIEAGRIAFLCIKNDVIPICHLTDLPYTPWRRQVNLLGCFRGVTTTLMSPRSVGGSLLSKRVVGPVPMAFSLQSFKRIRALRQSQQELDVITLGSMYEPRKTFLENVGSGLEGLGYNFKIFGRGLGGERITHEDYWRLMSGARCVLTTGFQMQGEHTTLHAMESHLIYRYIEALVAGATLVADAPASIERLLRPNEHFLCFDSEEDAIKKIDKYLTSESSIDSRQRIESIVELNLFWLLVDYGLQEDSLT